MTVLGFDFTGNVGSLAVVRDDVIIAEDVLTSPDGFAHLIFDRLNALLSAAGIALAEVDCFASASGPGSFTGVRVGLSTAKGLAEAGGKPAIGISNLRAMASLAWTSHGATSRIDNLCSNNVAQTIQSAASRLVGTTLRAPVIDARRNDVYAALYDSSGNAIVPEQVNQLAKFLEVASVPASNGFQFITQNAEWLRELLPEAFANWPVVESPATLAASVARCAADNLSRGAVGDPASLDANYVRRSDAELFWRDSH